MVAVAAPIQDAKYPLLVTSKAKGPRKVTRQTGHDDPANCEEGKGDGVIQGLHGPVLLVKRHCNQNHGQGYTSNDEGKDGCVCINLVPDGSDAYQDETNASEVMSIIPIAQPYTTAHTAKYPLPVLSKSLSNMRKQAPIQL
jgi:hypothetical protein